jgi:excisionase family DNA binding protein
MALALYYLWSVHTWTQPFIQCGQSFARFQRPRRGDRSDVAIGESVDNQNSTETENATRNEPELLRVVEASKLMSLSRRKVYEMAERGEIPVIRIGSAVRIPRRKLLLWIEQQTRFTESVKERMAKTRRRGRGEGSDLRAS